MKITPAGTSLCLAGERAGDFGQGICRPRLAHAKRKDAVRLYFHVLPVAHTERFHQWHEGHLSTGLWAGWETLVMNLVNTPGGAKFWVERSYVFGQDFQGHVAEVMARKPDPRAKAFGVVPVSHVSEAGGSARLG